MIGPMIDPRVHRTVPSTGGAARTCVRATARIAAGVAVALGTAWALGAAPAAGRVPAQDGEPAASIELATAAPTVGDRIAFDVRVTHPAGTTIVWPDLKGRWGPFEVLAVGPRRVLDGTAVPGAMVYVEHRVITATAFTTGTLQTPSLRLTAVDVGGATRTVVAAPIDVVIRSVLDPNDTAPRGPRGPVDLPTSGRRPLILGALSVVGALITLLVWALRRLFRRHAPTAVAPAPVHDFRSPLDLANAALDDLAAADLPVRGRVIEHYTRLADTLRLFVERAYHVPALERTTPELAAAFGPPGTRDVEVEPLLAVLSDADLVKFARIIPDAATARDSLADARALLGGLWGAAERRRIAAEAAAARAALPYGGSVSPYDGRPPSDASSDASSDAAPGAAPGDDHRPSPDDDPDSPPGRDPFPSPGDGAAA